eukprot:1470820-Prymnesium_polylepis.1
MTQSRGLTFVYPNAAQERGCAQLQAGAPLAAGYAFVSEAAANEAPTVQRLLFQSLLGWRHATRASKAELYFSFIAPHRPPFR